MADGFRSLFRDWADEETDRAREVIEAALVHVVQNKVEVGYVGSAIACRVQPRPSTPRCRAASRSRRDRIGTQLADLEMPGAPEALDEVLAYVDGRTAGPHDDEPKRVYRLDTSTMYPTDLLPSISLAINPNSDR